MDLTVDTLPRGSEPEWDEYVLNHPDATLSHLSAWRRVVERAYRLPSTYMVVKREQEIQGVLPLVHMKGLFAPNRMVSMPFLDQGGVLSTSPEASGALIDSAARLTQSLGAEGLDLRAPLPHLEAPPGTSSRVRFVLSLPDTDDDLWKRLGPKVRNQIRKAEKEGLTSDGANYPSLPEFYGVFSRNMRDLGSPTHSLAFFEAIARQLGDRFRLYLTYDTDKQPVATAVAIHFKNCVTVPWASSLRSARSLCPNHSLYWRILRDARQWGASVFDFGRSSVGTGTYQFKKQWGAEPVPLAWTFLDRMQNPETDYYLAPRSRSAATQIWRHLPLPLTLKLGPVIRRQLPN